MCQRIAQMSQKLVFYIKELGLSEMLVALLPILGAYYLGPVPISFWIVLLLTFISISKKRGINFRLFSPFIVFIIFYFFHELLMAVLVDGFNVNKRVEQIVQFCSVLFIVPLLDIKKLNASLNFVSLICIIGLLYQLLTIMAGGTVHPIEIPGLQMVGARLAQESLRPSSFFMEPAAYTAYMYAPLMFSLINRSYWWSAIIIISMLLSGSTTAFITTFIILAVYIYTQGLFKRNTFIILIFALGILYALSHFSIFEVGRNKLDETDFDNTVRIWQGPHIVKTMNLAELLFGAPYEDTGEYYNAGRLIGVDVNYSGSVIYMSTTWYIIFRFGIIGLLLYLNIYYKIAKQFREIIPYVFCLFITMFSAAIGVGSSYVFTIVILYTATQQSNKLIKQNNQ